MTKKVIKKAKLLSLFLINNKDIIKKISSQISQIVFDHSGLSNQIPMKLILSMF